MTVVTNPRCCLPQAECPLIAHAGEGAQSSVDIHEMDGRLVAVKKPKCEEDGRSLLLEEQALAHMDHSSIPKPLAWLAMDDGRHALSLPEFTGGSLRDLFGCEHRPCPQLTQLFSHCFAWLTHCFCTLLNTQTIEH